MNGIPGLKGQQGLAGYPGEEGQVGDRGFPGRQVTTSHLYIEIHVLKMWYHTEKNFQKFQRVVARSLLTKETNPLHSEKKEQK